eukprot:GEMP01054333.1.p1 GENE.GEMP01054333.1~~GEMP01054333.1.p1  ORF type:complete len:309 (+),score=49.16 GEMP01054333.1:51-977(+)
MTLEKQPRSRVGYFALSVGSHFLWGAYPVCTRFLQTQTEPALSGLTILTLAMFIAGICAFLSAKRDKSEPLNHHMTSRKWKWGIFYGAITLCRATTNTLSTGYTFAYYCLVVSLLNPFITAVTSRWLLDDPFPTCFCVAAILSFMGAFAVIFGQSMMHTTLSLSSDDYIGVALAFASVCFSSSMRITMKKTKSVGLTKFQLVSFQYAFNFSVLLCVTCTQWEQWAAWSHISVTSVLVFLFFAVAIVFGATVTQIVVVIGVYFCIQIREADRTTASTVSPDVIGYAEVREREHGGESSHLPLEQDVGKS